MNIPIHSPRNRAAVFDLDGTLVDSMPLVIAMFSHAVEPFRPRPTPKEILDLLGGPPETCIRRLLGPAAAASLPDAWSRMVEYEREHSQDVVLFGGSRQLLGLLHDNGVKLAVWTGRDRHSTTSILRAHGLDSHFGALVCGDDLASHKPDPAGLFRSIEILGVEIDDALFIGDSDVDVLGGHAAGMSTMLVHHGRTVPPDITARALKVFAGTAEAYAAVERHFLGPRPA